MPVLAIGAVDLVAFVIALAVILVLLAFWVFGKVIESAFSHVPVIGGWVGSNITDAMKAAIAGVARIFDMAATGMAHFTWALATGVWHLLSQITATIGDAKSWAIRAYNTAMSGVLAAENYAVALEHQALGIASGWVATAEGDARVLFDTAEAGIATVASDVVSEANRVLGEAETYAAGLAGAVQSEAVSLFGTAEGFATGLFDQVSSEATRLFGQAEADAGAAVAGVEATVAGLAGDLAGLKGDVAGIAGALGLVATIPALSTLVQSLTAEADQCLKPLCDTVTPRAPQLGKLGQFLAGIEDLAIDALVAALFVEAATHPGAVASEAETLIRAVGEPVVTGIRDLTGL